MRQLRPCAEWRIGESAPADRKEAAVSSVVSAEATLCQPNRPSARNEDRFLGPVEPVAPVVPISRSPVS